MRRPDLRSESWVVAGIQVALVLAGLGLWEGLVRAGLITEFFFGQPSRMVAYLWETGRDGYLALHAWVTVYEQVLGFVVGTLFGTAVGLALWWSRWLSEVLEPFAVVLNATPKVVMAPILVVWFGIGLLSKVMIAVMICAIVAWLSAFEGTRSADADQMDMVRALGGRRWHVFRKIVLPSSLPWILSTLRLNIGLALIGVITGEFLSSTHGLGYLVDRTAKLYEMSHTLAVLFVIAVVASVQYYIVNWLEARFLGWSRPEPEPEFIT